VDKTLTSLANGLYPFFPFFAAKILRHSRVADFAFHYRKICNNVLNPLRGCKRESVCTNRQKVVKQTSQVQFFTVKTSKSKDLKLNFEPNKSFLGKFGKLQRTCFHVCCFSSDGNFSRHVVICSTFYLDIFQFFFAFFPKYVKMCFEVLDNNVTLHNCRRSNFIRENIFCYLTKHFFKRVSQSNNDDCRPFLLQRNYIIV